MTLEEEMERLGFLDRLKKPTPEQKSMTHESVRRQATGEPVDWLKPIAETGKLALSVAPGSGGVIAGQDYLEAAGKAQKAIKEGDVSGAVSSGLDATTAALGLIPGMALATKGAKGAVKGVVNSAQKLFPGMGRTGTERVPKWLQNKYGYVDEPFPQLPSKKDYINAVRDMSTNNTFQMEDGVPYLPNIGDDFRTFLFKPMDAGDEFVLREKLRLAHDGPNQPQFPPDYFRTAPLQDVLRASPTAESVAFDHAYETKTAIPHLDWGTDVTNGGFVVGVANKQGQLQSIHSYDPAMHTVDEVLEEIHDFVSKNAKDPSFTGVSRRLDTAVTDPLVDKFGLRNVYSASEASVGEADRMLSVLARETGIPPKALGISGDLNIVTDVDSRRINDAFAHQTSDSGKNQMSLAFSHGEVQLMPHEWAHAMDNYFGAIFGKSQTSKYMTGGHSKQHTKSGIPMPNMRPELRDKWNDLRDALVTDGSGGLSDFVKRSRQIDKQHNQQYISNPTEILARTMDAYIIHKLESVPPGQLDADSAAILDRMKTSLARTDGYQIMPSPDEMKRIVPAMDAFFKEIQYESVKNPATGREVLKMFGIGGLAAGVGAVHGSASDEVD